MITRNHGIIEQLMTKLKVKNFMSAKAEEVVATPTPVATPQINYEDLISRARKEEKDKLYPKITKLEVDNTALLEKHNKALLSLGEKDTEISGLKSKLSTIEGAKPSDSEEVETLKAEIKALKKTIKEHEADKVDVEAIKKGVVDEYEVKLYKADKLREVGDNVIPELVFGTTKEEIDSSLEIAKTRYQAIVGKLNVQAPKLPGVNVSTSSMASKSVNVEDISKMTPPEWAEYRKSLNLR